MTDDARETGSGYSELVFGFGMVLRARRELGVAHCGNSFLLQGVDVLCLSQPALASYSIRSLPV